MIGIPAKLDHGEEALLGARIAPQLGLTQELGVAGQLSALRFQNGIGCSEPVVHNGRIALPRILAPLLVSAR